MIIQNLLFMFGLCQKLLYQKKKKKYTVWIHALASEMLSFAQLV